MKTKPEPEFCRFDEIKKLRMRPVTRQMFIKVLVLRRCNIFLLVPSTATLFALALDEVLPIFGEAPAGIGDEAIALRKCQMQFQGSIYSLHQGKA